MKNTHLLKFTIALGVVVMLISFVIVPDDEPWYYEVLLFNIGLWPWLLAKKQLKEVDSQLKSN